MKKTLTAIFLFLYLFSSYGQKEQSNSFALNIDQDLAAIPLGLNEDRNYTMGVSLSYTTTKTSAYIPSVVRKLTKIFDKNFKGDKTVTYKLEVTAFTPDSLYSQTIMYGDRPYGNIVALGTSLVGYSDDFTKKSTSSLSVGILGTNLGKYVQTGIHHAQNGGVDTNTPNKPRGWHHQISNGGEPTFLYTYQVKKLLTNSALSNKKARNYFDMNYGYEFLAGYYTGARGNLTMRVGFLDSRNWGKDFNPISSSTLTETFLSKKRKTELYLIGSVSPTYLVYNALLNGQVRASNYRLSFSEMRHLTLEWKTGLGFSTACGNHNLDIAWIINAGRTSELKDTEFSRNHYWGGLYINYGW